MKIKTKTGDTRSMRIKEISEDEITFNDDGIAIVRKEVGRELIKRYPNIVEVSEDEEE